MSNETELTKPKKKSPAKKLLKALVVLLIKVAVLCGIGFASWHYVGEIHILHDNNMYPHVKDGALLVTYKIEAPIKNDAVVYEHDGRICVGRIVGIAGDKIEINGETGEFTVNGLQPFENVFYLTYPADNDLQYPLTVDPDTYFILSDFRETLGDSRVYGCIPANNLCGKVVLMIQHRDI